MNQFQTFDEIIAAFKRRALLIIAIFLLGCGFSLYSALQQVKIYEATAVVQIENANIASTVNGQAIAAGDTTLRVRLVEQRLMSRDNLVKIIEDFNLYANEPLSMSQKVVRLRSTVRIDQILTTAQSWQPNATPSALTITAEHTDPQTAADLANAFMESVIAYSRERSISRAESTVAFFNDEEARARAELAELSDKVARYKSENAKYLAAGQDALRTQLADLREAELEIDQQILTLETNATRQRQELARQQITQLENQRSLIQSRIDAIEADLLAAPAYEREFTALELELQRLEDQTSTVSRRRVEAEMGQILEDRQQGGRFEALETAMVPENPINRSRKKTAMLGAIASGIVAFAAAFAFEMFNPVIRNAAQMERAIGLQPVVQIPVVQTRPHRQRILWTRIFGTLALLAGAGILFRVFQDRVLATGLLPWFTAEQP